MDTNEHEFGSSLLYKDDVYAIVGCAMEVINTFGHGLHEKPYENALAVEFALRGIGFEQQRTFSVIYKTEWVGEFIPDFVVMGKIIVDTKTVESIGNSERGQMINYLRITGHKLGLIVNFKHPQLQWERIVL